MILLSSKISLFILLPSTFKATVHMEFISLYVVNLRSMCLSVCVYSLSTFLFSWPHFIYWRRHPFPLLNGSATTFIIQETLGQFFIVSLVLMISLYILALNLFLYLYTQFWCLVLLDIEDLTCTFHKLNQMYIDFSGHKHYFIGFKWTWKIIFWMTNIPKTTTKNSHRLYHTQYFSENSSIKF